MDLKELKKEIEKNQRKIQLLDGIINNGKSTSADRRIWVGCKCYIIGVKQTIEAIDKTIVFDDVGEDNCTHAKNWKEIEKSLSTSQSEGTELPFKNKPCPCYEGYHSECPKCKEYTNLEDGCACIKQGSSLN